MNIFIYDYFKCILICLAVRKVFWMLVDYPFGGFNCGGKVEKFNGSEDDDVFLGDAYDLSFVTVANFNITGVE